MMVKTAAQILAEIKDEKPIHRRTGGRPLGSIAPLPGCHDPDCKRTRFHRVDPMRRSSWHRDAPVYRRTGLKVWKGDGHVHDIDLLLSKRNPDIKEALLVRSQLVAERRRRGYTQKQMALKVGRNQAVVSRFERGQVSLSDVALMYSYADAVGLKLKVSFDLEEK